MPGFGVGFGYEYFGDEAPVLTVGFPAGALGAGFNGVPVGGDIPGVKVELRGRKPFSPASLRVSEFLEKPAMPMGGWGFYNGLMWG